MTQAKALSIIPLNSGLQGSLAVKCCGWCFNSFSTDLIIAAEVVCLYWNTHCVLSNWTHFNYLRLRNVLLRYNTDRIILSSFEYHC